MKKQLSIIENNEVIDVGDTQEVINEMISNLERECGCSRAVADILLRFEQGDRHVVANINNGGIDISTLSEVLLVLGDKVIRDEEVGEQSPIVLH